MSNPTLPKKGGGSIGLIIEFFVKDEGLTESNLCEFESQGH